MCDDSILTGSCPKLEGNDVWVLLLGCDLQNGDQLVSVLHPRPPCPVRELTQYHQALCCEQQVAGRDVTLHTIFYNMEPLTTGLVIPGRDGGRWGDEGEIEESLRQITRTGGGRFHHFKLSGQS